MLFGDEFEIRQDIYQVNYAADVIDNASQDRQTGSGFLLTDPAKSNPHDIEAISGIVGKVVETHGKKFLGLTGFHVVTKHGKILVHRDCLPVSKGWVWHVHFHCRPESADLPEDQRQPRHAYYLIVVNDEYVDFNDLMEVTRNVVDGDGFALMGFVNIARVSDTILNL